MNTILLYLIAALAAYLVGGVNPAIILSNRLYHIDIRQLGSRNPGFTNFRRFMGSHSALYVLLFDMGKSALLCALFGWLFRRSVGLYHLGAAYVMLFAMLGHAYPVWYGFHGGKSVAVFAGAIWFIDWRAGLIAFVILAALLWAFRYMSLAVLCAAASCPVTLAIAGVEHPAVLALVISGVLLMIWRHRENIKRLCQGTEARFSWKG